MASWFRPVIDTLLCAAILGLGGWCFLLVHRSRAEGAKWRRIADQKYREGRSEAAQILRSAVDQIADDKNRLGGMTDRELMTEAVLGLSGLGRRMDRLEDSLHSLSQFEELLQTVNSQTDLIRENAELLSRQVTEAQDAAASFQSAVAGTGEAVYSLSDSTHSVEQLLEDVSRQIGTLTAFSDSFSQLQGQMQQVLKRVNQTLRVSEDNPAAALGQMDSRISGVYSQLENLSEGLNLMARSLEEMQETLEAVNRRTRASQPEPLSGEPS